MMETIRPARVLEELRFLLNTELYRKHNLTISSDWFGPLANTEEVRFHSMEQLIRHRMETAAEALNVSDQEENRNSGDQETPLDNELVENNALIDRIALAPGEGRRLVDMTMDEDVEELSFPTISCGQIFKCKTTYVRKAKSQI